MPCGAPLIPCRRPRRRSTRLEVGHDVDHDRFARRERFGQGWRYLIWALDPDAAHTKTSRHRREIRWPKTDQLLSPARPVAGNAVDTRQILAKAGIVVDDECDRDAA